MKQLQCIYQHRLIKGIYQLIMNEVFLLEIENVNKIFFKQSPTILSLYKLAIWVGYYIFLLFSPGYFLTTHIHVTPKHLLFFISLSSQYFDIFCIPHRNKFYFILLWSFVNLLCDCTKILLTKIQKILLTKIQKIYFFSVPEFNGSIFSCLTWRRVLIAKLYKEGFN